MIKLKTLQELKDSIIGSIESHLGVKLPTTGKNALRTVGNTLAGELKLLYLSLGKVQKNIFVDTADPASQGGTLERWGNVKLGRNPFPARAGEYLVIVTGDVGAVISAGTTFKSDDESTSPGYLFVLDSEYTLVSTTDSIVLRALTPGLESELEAQDTLTATAPIALVDSSVTVYAQTVEPLAAETIEEYRTATIEAFRLETQGGSAADYRLWARDAQGTRFVYPYAKSGVCSEVDLFVEANVDVSVDGKGTPSAALLSDVEDVINFDPDETFSVEERGRRPIQVIVNYLPITVLDVVVNIENYQNLTTEKQTLIDASIKTLVDGIRPFVASADVLENKNDVLDTNKIVSAIISAVSGSQFGAVTMTVDGNTVSTYTFTFGDIPYLDSVNYV